MYDAGFYDPLEEEDQVRIFLLCFLRMPKHRARYKTCVVVLNDDVVLSRLVLCSVLNSYFCFPFHFDAVH